MNRVQDFVDWLRGFRRVADASAVERLRDYYLDEDGSFYLCTNIECDDRVTYQDLDEFEPLPAARVLWKAFGIFVTVASTVGGMIWIYWRTS